MTYGLAAARVVRGAFAVAAWGCLGSAPVAAAAAHSAPIPSADQQKQPDRAQSSLFCRVFGWCSETDKGREKPPAPASTSDATPNDAKAKATPTSDSEKSVPDASRAQPAAVGTVERRAPIAKPSPPASERDRGNIDFDSRRGVAGLEHCEKPLATLAVVEPQDFVLSSLRTYKLQSPVSLIRLMVQQSNCFIIVERAVGMQNSTQERDLQNSADPRTGSNRDKSQIVVADYVLTPSVVFSEGTAGGVGGAVGGIFGGKFGALSGGLKFKEAQTSMLVADARSAVQVAAAEASTRKADMRLGAGLFGGAPTVAAGGYGNTNEGKIIAAALVDNYNNIVDVIKGDPSLTRGIGTLAQEATTARGATKAASSFAEGDVLVPKISGVKVMAAPSDAGKVTGTLQRSDEVVVVGEEKDGYIKVQGPTASGWVKTVLVTKH